MISLKFLFGQALLYKSNPPLRQHGYEHMKMRRNKTGNIKPSCQSDKTGKRVMFNISHNLFNTEGKK